MEFPRLVYRSASEHTVADDAAEFDSLLENGWFASVPEADEKKHAIAKAEPAPAAVSETKATAGKGKTAKITPAAVSVPATNPWAGE